MKTRLALTLFAAALFGASCTTKCDCFYVPLPKEAITIPAKNPLPPEWPLNNLDN